MKHIYIGALAGLLVLTAHLPAEVSYSKEVQPLLEKHCYQCHGGKDTLSELDLTSAAGINKGGLKGVAITAGKPGQSSLYQHVAGLKAPQMPLGSKLDDASIELLKVWIAEGAKIDAEVEVSDAAPQSQDEKQWWAFRNPVRHKAPQASDARWQGNPIDQFLFASMADKGVQPAPPADRRTLIRRVYLDLTGLLPPPAAVEAFLANDSPTAFSNIVEELLASPRYGERWGRHWLDVVRYADSSGYEHDYDYPHAWRYRDYVIDSFNDDKPYDRFVKEQLAGDELDDSGYDELIATSFYRIGARVLFREKDNPHYRYNYLDDMIATSSKTFMALSVECARCHDHKFDPIKQVDYYRMMAIFFPHIRYDFPLAPPEVIVQHERETAEIEAEIKPLEKQLRAIKKPYSDLAFQEQLKSFPEDIQLAFATPEDQRTEGQKLLAAQVRPYGLEPEKMYSPEDLAKHNEIEAQIAELEKLKPEPLPKAMGIRDGDYRSAPDGLGDEPQPGKGERETFENAGAWIPVMGKPFNPPQAFLLPSADWRTKGPEVEPGLIEVIARADDFRPTPPTNGRASSGRRKALADWIASPDHPLTARVAVNRIWQHHFGRGIVLTANNFGKMGTLPTHPELLDWLATEFTRNGWSIKHMHRLILSSQAYQTASSYESAENLKADPENFLLWRYPQRRLEGEAIRDIVLTAAGTLNLEAGGEPFFPPIPQSVRDNFIKGDWDMNEEGPEVWRRSVFSYWKRGLRYPLFEVFDLPSPNVSCERRTTTTVPTQALTLLNNEFLLDQAARFAKRIDTEAEGDVEQIERAYEIALSRRPTKAEAEGNLLFLARQRDYHSGRTEDVFLAALTDLSHVILNLNEFVYLP